MSCFCPNTRRKHFIDEQTSEKVCGACGVVVSTEPVFDTSGVQTPFDRLLGTAPARHKCDPNADASDTDIIKRFQRIDRMLGQVGASTTMGDAAITIMERIIDAEGMRANTAMLAACIWIAARDTGRAIPMESMRRMWGFRMKAFRKCLWAVMDHGIDIRSNADTTMIITRICSDINAPMRARVASMGIHDRLNKTGVLCGRSPYVVAACIVYVAGDCHEQRLRLDRIASAAGVPPASICRMRAFLESGKCL